MKKMLALLLVLALCLSLSACKSEEAKNAEALIAAIGDVTLDSEAAIAAAEAAYDALSDSDKSGVENHALLAEARTAFDALAQQAQVDAVQNLISAIGEVTLDSEAAVIAAEDAFNALTAELQSRVSNTSALTEARAALDAARQEALMQALAGTWVHEIYGFGEYRAIMSEVDCAPVDVYAESDGSSYSGAAHMFTLAEDGSFRIGGITAGTWTVSADGTQVTAELTVNGDEAHTVTLNVTEEDGFTKLFGEFVGTKAAAYVRDADFAAAFDMKYAVIHLNDGNFRDYIGEPEYMGHADTLDGDGHYWYFFPSQAYDDGLVYLGSDASVNIQFNSGPNHSLPHSFPVMIGFSVSVSDLRLGTWGHGEMFYVKSEYVAQNYIAEDGFRTLELTNGMVLRFTDSVVWDSYEAFWTITGADYNSYIY